MINNNNIFVFGNWLQIHIFKKNSFYCIFSLHYGQKMKHTRFVNDQDRDDIKKLIKSGNMDLVFR